MHDGLVPWIVEGAAHGVPGQAGAIEQHTGELLNLFEDDFNFGSCYRFDNLFLHVLGCLPSAHHLPKAHVSEAASLSLSRRFKRRV